MSVYSVPCWCCLDKAVAPVASTDNPVRVPISSVFERLFDPLVCCFASLTAAAGYPLTQWQASKGALTFGRSRPPCREDRLYLGELPASGRHLKSLPDRVFNMPDIDAEGGSLLGEQPSIFSSDKVGGLGRPGEWFEETGQVV
jgi:hypothetical protein